MADRLIITHRDCWDGIASAWAVLQHDDWKGTRAIIAAYGDAPPAVKGKHVVIVDFSYPRDELIQMHAEAASLLVLDHHKTAEEELRGLDFCVFDMTRSGCRMAWEHFHPGQPLPRALAYIDEGDRWHFSLPHSREMAALLRSHPKTIEGLLAFAGLVHETPPRAVIEGEAIVRARAQMVAGMAAHASPVQIGGERGFATCCSVRELTSDLGHALCEKGGFGAAWIGLADGRVAYSLRSREGGADVSALARQFGGGGHEHAAGFSVPWDTHVGFLVTD